MEVSHSRGDIRCCHEVFALLDAEFRDRRVEGNRQQANHDIGLTDHVLNGDFVCHVDEHRPRVLVFTGKSFCLGQRIASC